MLKQSLVTYWGLQKIRAGNNIDMYHFYLCNNIWCFIMQIRNIKWRSHNFCDRGNSCETKEWIVMPVLLPKIRMRSAWTLPRRWIATWTPGWKCWAHRWRPAGHHGTEITSIFNWEDCIQSPSKRFFHGSEIDSLQCSATKSMVTEYFRLWDTPWAWAAAYCQWWAT